MADPRSPLDRTTWTRDVLTPALARAGERRRFFSTVSGRAVPVVSGPEAVEALDYDRDLGDPGRFPFTRGLHADGYHGRRWTMRQFAGFGTPDETNARYHELLDAGATGLSVAFDLPTLMGRDPDDPLSAGEVGRCGVSVATVDDMDRLFAGIDMGAVTTSMTINSPASMVLALYLVVAERRGVSWDRLAGTIQNDILKEFIAQKEFIYPPRPSMRLVTDLVAFCGAHLPRWNTISVSGYHIREAGATAGQELAMTIRNGVEYVEWGRAAGLDVDRFAPRISFFFNVHNDFFEEIAKFRAARRVWARLLRDRFGATADRTCHLRFHAQTAGSSLTAQQAYTNVARTAIQALAAVLGGASSLHTNALDEALGLPTADAAMLALRTQQILAHETGAGEVVDALGGSWHLESLTDALEAEVLAYVDRIDRLGGMVAAIEAGDPQRDVVEAAWRQQRAIESGDRTVVGVNAYVEEATVGVPVQQIDEAGAADQIARVRAVRTSRDGPAAQHALDRLRAVAGGGGNTLEALLDCARCDVTVGEMCDVLRAVWGEYVEPRSIW